MCCQLWQIPQLVVAEVKSVQELEMRQTALQTADPVVLQQVRCHVDCLAGSTAPDIHAFMYVTWKKNVICHCCLCWVWDMLAEGMSQCATWHGMQSVSLYLQAAIRNNNWWPRVYSIDIHRPAYLCVQHLHTNITVEAINAFQVVIVHPQYFQVHLYNRLWSL